MTEVEVFQARTKILDNLAPQDTITYGYRETGRSEQFLFGKREDYSFRSLERLASTLGALRKDHIINQQTQRIEVSRAEGSPVAVVHTQGLKDSDYSKLFVLIYQELERYLASENAQR